jgi:hypothetical protein
VSKLKLGEVMPQFAHLLGIVPCPNCGTDLAMGERIDFQWGYCSNPHGGGCANEYHLGDAIRWRVDGDDNVPAWSDLLTDFPWRSRENGHAIFHAFV